MEEGDSQPTPSREQSQACLAMRGAKEEDEVNRRITSGRIGNHNMRDTAKYEKMG